MAGDGDLRPLFDAILKHVPAPSGDVDGGMQLLVAALDRDDYQGRYAIGKFFRGVATPGEAVTVVHPDGKRVNSHVEKIFVYAGLKRVEVQRAEAGDIVAVTGAPESHIGDTIADTSNPEALPTIRVEEPTLRITMGPNTSPFKGRDGTMLTGRQIGERLERELETNIGFRLNRRGTVAIHWRDEASFICRYLSRRSVGKGLNWKSQSRRLSSWKQKAHGLNRSKRSPLTCPRSLSA